MKKLFLMMALGLFFVACNNDDVPNDDPTPGVPGAVNFVGKLTVTPNEGSRFEAFDADEIEFILTEDVASEQNSDLNYVNLSMPQIKFVKEMPVWIALELPGLAELQLLDQEWDFTFGVDEMIPYYMGQPYDPMGDGKYTISNLVGDYKYATKELVVDFDCYSMHVNYVGKWVTNSTPMEELID